MNKRAPLTDESGEVRELTAADLRHFKPASEVLAPELYAGLLEMNRRAGVRGPQKAPTKEVTTIRFDADVLAALRATGKGWQTRVNDAMREWLKTHSPTT
ncbi:MAG: BrnA antitoxin family protein [Rhodoferax sp.]